MLKSKWGWLIVGLLMGILLVSVADAGTTNDPLVTLSYIEKRLTDLKTELKATDQTMPVFEVYNIKKDTTVTFGASTEFIIRRGKAKVIDPLANMIPDLTTGVDIPKESLVPLNHLMLVPQADGRGILAIEDIWIMIKGPHTIH